ncbi:MAG: SusC/RagA family TonB-linked outer membrane protein [Bacteroidia bacterium]|nr:SusC/RagA family TonB-linked outer membrane protein [Bacteroidia bacterium]
MKKILLTCLGLCLCLGMVWAQDRMITGRVTAAEDGTPLPGVNVIVKGTSNGTVTDVEGKYSLSVPQGATTLAFSFIGLQSQDVEVGARAVIDVQMKQDVTQLNEIVVTGYGEQEVKGITGSVVRVGSENISQIPIADVSRTLQGNVAGLFSTGASGSPGAATQVRIRGIGSAVASAEPLYVVDGIAIQTGDLSSNTATANALANLNPNDIENVIVLKDAAATAQYGSRASNGVILITTKSGKIGATQINVNAQYGLSDQAYQKYERLNAEEYVMLRKEAYLNSGGDPAGADDFAGSAAIETDWYDVIFRTGKTQSYDVSAQGGDQKTQFFVSGGYFKQEGITIHTSLERFSARFNVDHQATEKFKMGLNFAPSYSKQISTSDGSNFNSLVLQSMLLPPNAPVRNEDGILLRRFFRCPRREFSRCQ